MTLFELQAWLGHKDPATTQNYAKITPNTLTKAYTQAGYFARNLRTIEVLLDRDAVTSGAAADGQPWQHYDLGHGYCSYTFFEQCPHRMACARCDFYTPKDSTRAQLLEASANLQRMLASIPLTDDERAAVDDGRAALDSLLGRLADVPTPAGVGHPAHLVLLAAVQDGGRRGADPHRVRPGAGESVRLIGALLDPEHDRAAADGAGGIDADQDRHQRRAAQTVGSRRSGLGWAESSRGESLAWIELDPAGRISRARLRPAAVRNWRGFDDACRSQNVFTDIPIIEASFWLTVAGTAR